MHRQNTFTRRPCPCCSGQTSKTLTNISVKEIAANNWSYRKDITSLLNVTMDDSFEIVKCSECAFIYSKHLPSDDFLNILYDQVIDLSSKQALINYKDEYPRRLRYLSSLSHLLNDTAQNIKVLDFGAGFGQTSKILQAQGMQVIAYETSSLRRTDLLHSGINTISTENELIENGPYSVIICDNVLEHVPNPDMVIRLFKSVSTLNTILFVSVPSYEPKDVDHYIKTTDMSLNPWEHLNYFDISHLDNFLIKHNFDVISNVELKSTINLGLRAELNTLKRLKNGISSFFRLIKFMQTGLSVESVNSRFYRFTFDNHFDNIKKPNPRSTDREHFQ